MSGLISIVIPARTRPALARLAVEATFLGGDSGCGVVLANSSAAPLGQALKDCRLRYVPRAVQEVAMAHRGCLLPERRLEGMAASPAGGPIAREASETPRAPDPPQLASPAGSCGESRNGHRSRGFSRWH